MSQAIVILYGHCGCPGTDRARRFLNDRAIPFCDKEISDPDARAEWASYGVWATPLLIIGGVTMVGFDARQCERLLARLNRR